jgi:hypothetical protein
MMITSRQKGLLVIWILLYGWARWVSWSSPLPLSTSRFQFRKGRYSCLLHWRATCSASSSALWRKLVRGSGAGIGARESGQTMPWFDAVVYTSPLVKSPCSDHTTLDNLLRHRASGILVLGGLTWKPSLSIIIRLTDFSLKIVQTTCPALLASTTTPSKVANRLALLGTQPHHGKWFRAHCFEKTMPATCDLDLYCKKDLVLKDRVVIVDNWENLSNQQP